MAPPAGGGSAKRNSQLTAVVFEWAEGNGFIAFDSSAGFEFANSAVLSPDAAVVRREDWEALTPQQREDFVPIAPVIAIELASKSDRPKDLRKKLMRFREAGTAYVVMIDPYRNEIWTDGEAPPAFDLDFRPLLDLK